jgi:hypothetical protein
MELKRAMQNLAKAISEEAERNPDFEARIRKALGLPAADGSDSRSVQITHTLEAGSPRRRNRRTLSVLDPVQLAQESEQSLREQLALLTIEQLKDIVADHGMDPSKLVMKWKTPERIANHIVEMAVSRSRKGDAFRS